MKENIPNTISKDTSILVINDNDSSVNYHTAIADNNYNYKPDLAELHTIYRNGEDIFKYCTSECLTLILTAGEEISLNEYSADSNKPVKFIKISTPELRDYNSEIIISALKTHFILKNKQWIHSSASQQWNNSERIKFIEKYPERDLDGFENTRFITETVKLIDIPAFTYCNNLSLKYGQHEYAGYLPSIGQLAIISEYIDLINAVFNTIKSSGIDINNCQWWSSTEFDERHAYCLKSGRISNYNKAQSYLVLPLFKQIR